MLKQSENKLQYVWSILCESSIIDAETNNISINKVLEQIQLTPPKGAILGKDINANGMVVPINFELVTMWKKTTLQSVEANVKVEVVDPKQTTVLTTSNPLKLASSLQRLRSRIRFSGIKVTIPGEYVFSVYIREKGQRTFTKVGEAYLEVRIQLSEKS